jgi:hypothetical protein
MEDAFRIIVFGTEPKAEAPPVPIATSGDACKSTKVGDVSMVIRVWQLAAALVLVIAGVPIAIYLIGHGTKYPSRSSSWSPRQSGSALTPASATGARVSRAGQQGTPRCGWSGLSFCGSSSSRSISCSAGASRSRTASTTSHHPNEDNARLTTVSCQRRA